MIEQRKADNAQQASSNSAQPGASPQGQQVSFQRHEDNNHGAYLGTLHGFNGTNIDSNADGGISGAMTDFDHLRKELGGGNPQLVSAGNPGIALKLGFPTQFVRSQLSSGGYINLRIYGPMTVLTRGTLFANARIDIPARSFDGQRYSITLHYDGTGDMGH